MQSHIHAIPPQPALPTTTRTASPIRWLSHWISHWFSLARRIHLVIAQRRQLAKLTDRQLADFGTTRHQAMNEMSRHFWDLPAK